jgi:hypothetical protein
MRCLLVLAALAGCAPIHPDPEAGRSFAIQYELYHFGNAMDGVTPHGGTLSWFECVEGSPFEPSV